MIFLTEVDKMYLRQTLEKLAWGATALVLVLTLAWWFNVDFYLYQWLAEPAAIPADVAKQYIIEKPVNPTTLDTYTNDLLSVEVNTDTQMMIAGPLVTAYDRPARGGSNDKSRAEADLMNDMFSHTITVSLPHREEFFAYLMTPSRTLKTLLDKLNDNTTVVARLPIYLEGYRLTVTPALDEMKHRSALLVTKIIWDGKAYE